MRRVVWITCPYCQAKLKAVNRERVAAHLAKLHAEEVERDEKRRGNP